MKKILLVLALFTASLTYAQSGNYGVKAGLNYNGNGSLTSSAGEVLDNPDRNVGYHVGVYGKIGSSLYVRPELVFTSISSSYEGGRDFKMQKLDLPVLAGVRVFGPLHAFIGPAFQLTLNTDYDDAELSDVKNDITVGLNVGLGVSLGRLGVDVRYERGFSDNEASFINSNITELSNGSIDTRPDQIILSLSVAL